MQKIILALILLLLGIHTHANNDKKTPSTIDAVTVYLHGAEISRTAMVNVIPGMNEFLIHDLSPEINKESIQIAGLKNTTILSMTYSISYLEKKKNSEEVKALKKQIEALELQKSKKENTSAGLQYEQKLLDNNQRINSDNTTLSLEKIKQISSYYAKRLTAIHDQQFNLNLEVKKLTKKIHNLNQELNKISANSKEQRGTVKLKIDAPTATNLALAITYTIRNAGWFPLYDIKAANTNTPLDIVYKANVYQRTGSDWKAVHIILSTGDPSTNNRKPILHPKYLNVIQNRGMMQKRAMAARPKLSKMAEAASLELEEAVAMDAAAPPQTYNATVTAKQEGITNTRFEITKKYTINSNAEVTVIEIDKFKMPADYEHYVAPELNEKVFLTATLGNWEQYNLLSGEANIYFEGSYAGKTSIDPQATTDHLTVSLGIDPSIVVKRKQLDNFKSKSFIGNTKIVDRSYEIIVKNNKTSTINLIVTDRIPVTQNKEIKIENILKDGADFNSKKGILTWKIPLKSKASTKKQFSYRVKYPKDKRINL